MTEDYRTRIYRHYATQFMDEGEQFELAGAERWGKAYDWYLRGLLPIDKQASILDLACGAGKMLHFLKTRGYQQVSGVDVSPEQVGIARQVVPDVHQGNLLEFLHTRKQAYDLIIGLDIIEHFHKDEVLQVLDNCFSALRPKGRLILQTPNADSPWGTYLRYGDFTHEVCFQHNSLSRLLRLCGFVNIESRELGPVPWGYSMKSTARWLLWRTIRMALQVYNLAETGSAGSGVFTRVFLAAGYKG